MICFNLYSSKPVSLGSFVSKQLNLYFEQLNYRISIYTKTTDLVELD